MRCLGYQILSFTTCVQFENAFRRRGINTQEIGSTDEKSSLISGGNTLSSQNNIDPRFAPLPYSPVVERMLPVIQIVACSEI